MNQVSAGSAYIGWQKKEENFIILQFYKDKEMIKSKQLKQV